MIIYYVNTFGCLAVAWLLAFAVMMDRHHIRRVWKPVMILFIMEHGILAYGSLEANMSHVDMEARQVLFCIILVALAASLMLVIYVLVTERGYLYGRGKTIWSAADRDSESQSPSRGRVPVQH